MTDEIEHSASGLYSTRLNGTSHKWDGLCQHDKSVEMGILTTRNKSARAQGFNL